VSKSVIRNKYYKNKRPGVHNTPSSLLSADTDHKNECDRDEYNERCQNTGTFYSILTAIVVNKVIIFMHFHLPRLHDRCIRILL
jgi:hypothetical protein